MLSVANQRMLDIERIYGKEGPVYIPRCVVVFCNRRADYDSLQEHRPPTSGRGFCWKHDGPVDWLEYGWRLVS